MQAQIDDLLLDIDRKDNLIMVEPENYNDVLNTLTIPSEYNSTTQVKPYFDVEIYNGGNQPIQWQLCVGQALSGTTTYNNVNTA